MRALARSGGEWERRYLPLGRWHLPASLAVFATASYVVGLIISATAPVSGLLTVGLTLEAVATLAFRVQAVGSAQRRLTAMGMRPGLRALLILMCLLLAPFDTLFCVLRHVLRAVWADLRRGDELSQKAPRRPRGWRRFFRR